MALSKKGDKIPECFTPRAAEEVCWKCDLGHGWPQKIVLRTDKRYRNTHEGHLKAMRKRKRDR